MKLFLSATSERGKPVTKSGNKRIAIEITVGDQDESQTILYATVEREETETENIYRLWNGDIQADKIIIPKNNICKTCGEINGKHSDDACEPYKEICNFNACKNIATNFGVCKKHQDLEK